MRGSTSSSTPAVPEEVPDDILARPRRHSSAAPAGLGLCGRIGVARPHDGRAARGRGGAGRAIRQRLAARDGFAESGLCRHARTRRRANWRANWARSGCTSKASPFWRGAIACTGTEFCKLAITETKGFTRWLVDELEERLPQFDQQLKLHVTGCPNSCGQHWIADIGLEGKKIKHEGKLTDAYLLLPGRRGGQHAGIARPVGYRCPAPLVPEAIERLLRQYLAGRQVRRESARVVRAPLQRRTARAACRRGAGAGGARFAGRPRAARSGGVRKTGNRSRGSPDELAADFSETRRPPLHCWWARARWRWKDRSLLKTGCDCAWLRPSAA